LTVALHRLLLLQLMTCGSDVLKDETLEHWQCGTWRWAVIAYGPTADCVRPGLSPCLRQPAAGCLHHCSTHASNSCYMPHAVTRWQSLLLLLLHVQDL